MNKIIKEINSLNKLYEIWNGPKSDLIISDLTNCETFLEKCIQYGEYLLAYDIVINTEESSRITEIYSLILIRLEMPNKAIEKLKILEELGHESEEFYGLLGRCYKELYLLNDRSSEYFDQAISYYKKCESKFSSIWASINIATLYHLNSNHELAVDKSNDLIKKIDAKKDKDFWELSSIAEAYLIQSDLESSIKYYKAAMDISENEIGNINSVRFNAQSIMSSLSDKIKIEKKLEEIFNIPKVLIFSGHMIDSPSRPESRFPYFKEQEVTDKMKKILDEVGNSVGISSAANGGDLIFIEELQKRNSKTSIVLPCSIDLFKKESVETGVEGNWGKRFDDGLSKSLEQIILYEDQEYIENIPFDFANKLIYGLAKIKARELRTKLIPVTVIDPLSEGLEGGTISAIKRWKEDNLDFKAIVLNDTDDIHLQENLKKVKVEKTEEIKGILFSDVKNFSKLKEKDYPVFCNTFYSIIKDLVNVKDYRVLDYNTWGDALHVVFDDVRSAGLFALDLAEKISGINWKDDCNIDLDLNIRTALHAGPVHIMQNPLTGLKSYLGSNICRAARLEPITPPGEVFASLEFSALCEIENIEDFNCRYVGQLPMSKKFGVFPTFHLVRDL